MPPLFRPICALIGALIVILVLPPVSVASPAPVVDVAPATAAAPAASATAAAVAPVADGGHQLVTWGDGLVGQLGDGRRFGQFTPARVNLGAAAGRTFDRLYPGYAGTCAGSAGTLVCWGQDALLLGDDRAINEEPTAVPIVTNPGGRFTGKTVTAAGVGGTHVCAVASNDLYCWGSVLGDPIVPNANVPIGREVLGGRIITSLAVGGSHTCLIADGQVFCLGSNEYGQLGDDTRETKVQLTAVGGALAGKRVTTIAAGDRTTCAIADGAAYCWGLNGGVLGDGTRVEYRSTPTPVEATAFGGSPVTQISVGSSHICATAGGAAYCWGYGYFGELGAGPDLASTYTPVPVVTDGGLAGRRISAVLAGSRSSCAIADGSAFCWGSNEAGQLGVGVRDGKTVLVTAVPLPVDTTSSWGSAEVTGLGVPTNTACSLVRGQVWCWGYNDYGRTGDPRALRAVEPLDVPLTGALADARITEIAAGLSHSCMIANGAPWCWGGIATTSPELFPAVPYPVDTRGVLAGKTLSDLSSGTGMSCVLADGLPYCWGAGAFRGPVSEGTIVDPSPVAIDTTATGGARMTALSVRGQIACGVAAGKVYCWGGSMVWSLETLDPTRALPVPGSSALTGKTVTAVAVGPAHTCVIADGRPYCWGQDSRGNAGGVAALEGPVALDTSGGLSGRTATAVAVGDETTCVIADARVFCWGEASMMGGLYAQQGDSGVPVQVLGQGGLGERPVTALSIGPDLACATAHGEAYCWGYRSASLYGPPAPYDLSAATGGTPVLAVSVGGRHAMALALPAPRTARPIGSVDSGVLTGPSFRMDGWALDPDTAGSPVTVDVYDVRPDGTLFAVRATADAARPDIAAAFPGAGAAHGFSATFGLTVAGTHRVCAYAIDTEVAAASTLIGCRTVELSGPVGSVDVATMTAPGTLSLSGWVAQPGATDLPTEVHAYVTGPDGSVQGYNGITTGLARPDVAAVLGWPSASTGFATAVPITQTGPSTVCMYGVGTTRANGTTVPAKVSLLGCRTVDVRNAIGSLDAVSWQGGDLIVRGWALNPNRTGPVEIHVYDGGPDGTVGRSGLTTGSPRPDVDAVFRDSGGNSGFDLRLPTTGAGLHSVCAYAITTGGGTGNVSLGCKDVAVG